MTTNTLRNTTLLILFTLYFTNMAQAQKQTQEQIFKSPVTQIGWIGVKANKLKEADDFFTKILEFDKHSSIPEMDIEIYQLPSGQYFELMSHKTPQVDVFKKPFIGFEVKNVENARKKLEANGLTFEGETFKIPTGGWAFFKDNEGNLMEIVQNPKRKTFKQDAKKLKIQGIGWVGLDVANHKESFKFYHDKLGFTHIPLPGENNPYTLMGFKNKTFFEVLDNLDKETGVNYPIVAFQVNDIKKSVEILKSHGVKLIGKIGGNPGLSVQKFEGPDGIIYQLAEITPHPSMESIFDKM